MCAGNSPVKIDFLSTAGHNPNIRSARTEHEFRLFCPFYAFFQTFARSYDSKSVCIVQNHMHVEKNARNRPVYSIMSLFVTLAAELMLANSLISLSAV
jgi:hypothetical protein